jgi:uncharacterized protein YecE (DUF72 family)
VEIRIGTAGWAIGEAAGHCFPTAGTSLKRYSTLLNAAEINSSFHRAHRLSTWQRWRDSVPENFRFSVKIPKTVSHVRKLVECNDLVDDFLRQVDSLGEKLAVLLLQLPPKLSFDAEVATNMLDLLLKGPASVVVEPRHPSWFDEEAESLLRHMRVGRVAADPAICPSAAMPGGWRGLEYWRLHGSPIKYRSSYRDRLASYAELLNQPRDPPGERWCIFDNTASSAAIGDAISLQKSIGSFDR